MLMKSHSLLSSRLPPYPRPPLPSGLPVHLEAGPDCEGGGVAESLQRGLPGAESIKAIYPPGNSLAPSGFTSGSSGPVQRKGSFPPHPLPLGNLPHRVCRLSRRNCSILRHCRLSRSSAVRVLQ